jgi:hypothetical protein
MKFSSADIRFNIVRIDSDDVVIHQSFPTFKAAVSAFNLRDWSEASLVEIKPVAKKVTITYQVVFEDETYNPQSDK